MKQYLDLLNKILTEGVEKESGRLNMPNTIGISNATIRMDLSEGFPLLTTKKMFLKGIIHELLWMLRGETNIKYLVDNGVNIWSGDAYRWYLKHWEKSDGAYTQEEFIEKIKEGNLTLYTRNGDWDNPEIHTSESYKLGDLGKVYGYQWRNQNGVDQVKEVLDGLKNNPYSRYHIIDSWNKSDFKDMALPPCHLLYQFIVRPLSHEERIHWWFHNRKPNRDVVDSFDEDPIEKQIEYLNESNVPKFYLDLNMYQRSVDSACGLPFNLASMVLLLKIISDVSNMIPGVANWIGGDTHIYIPHIETVKKQIQKIPYDLPGIKILKNLKTLEDIENLTINDFELNDYKSHEKLDYELFVGLKATPKKV
jgi:thymidylate synthase